MSTDSEKPFICQSPGCGQRFANHDHLQTHQQRHEFTLKFKGADALVVDQTPTPTRFLRNCEEAGLFQELENPFEQDFQTATNKQNGETEGAKETGSSNIAEPPNASGDNVSSLVTLPIAPPAALVNPDKPVAMASAPTHVNSTSALTKQKLLQTIQMKEQQKLLEQVITQQLGAGGTGASELLAQALKNISPMTESPAAVALLAQTDQEEGTFAIPQAPARRKRGRKPDEEDPEVKRQKFLERNRAAASRCRAKKKLWVEDLEKKSKEMGMVNTNLQQEVLMLRSEVQQLKSILIAHKDCPLIVHQTPEGKEGGSESDSQNVTLLTQLANMPSMSPLISSPVPLVGTVVPNISQSSLVSQQQAPEVATDVEICAETEAQSQASSSEQS